MKKLYPIITATSLVFIASLAGYHLPATGDRSPVKKIPVFIPDDTKVSLKNGTSLSGRLIKFDSQAKTIALGRDSKTKEVAMKEIKQIEFQGKAIKTRIDNAGRNPYRTSKLLMLIKEKRK